MFHSSNPGWGTTGAILYSRPTNPLSSDQSTLDTLHTMATLARKDAASPLVLAVAAKLRSGAPTPYAYAQAVWFWVHDHLTFVPHEAMVDAIAHEHAVGLDAQLLISPASLLAMPQPSGDCAIYSTLTAALLNVFSIPTMFRVTANDAAEPEVWSHVYVLAFVDSWINMDTSHGKYFGWEVQNSFRQLDYRL